MEAPYLGDTVAAGEPVPSGDVVGDAAGGDAVFMFDNSVRRTAAMVFVIASTCARTCCSETLL